MVENFFRPEELNACREAIKVLVDDLAKKLHDAGKITSKENTTPLMSHCVVMIYNKYNIIFSSRV